MTSVSSNLFTVALVIALASAIGALMYNSYLGKDVRKFFTRRPMSTYTSREVDLAFMHAPELLAMYEARGGMSPYEKRKAAKLSLSRIRAELARRDAV